MSNPRASLLARTKVPLEGLDGAFVHHLSMAEAEAWPDGPNRAFELFAMLVVDADDTPLFGLDEIDLIKSIEQDKFRPLFEQVLKVNGHSAAAAEDIEKN